MAIYNGGLNIIAQDISGKEDKSNKVTAWSSTTTHENYPSEKLVKDALDTKVNTANVLTLEEIKASTDLSGKVASASALKATHNKIIFYQFSLPSDISDTPLGDNKVILQSPYASNSVFYLQFIALVYGQYRNLNGVFEQIAALDNGEIVGVNSKTQLPAAYNGAVAFAIIYIR